MTNAKVYQGFHDDKKLESTDLDITRHEKLLFANLIF